ncbi:MAG: type I restriction enzyme HsdR N-terminal domain-containing protein [Anaerolineaceae bacterium]|nr:type I restriction enzyme HsdR N-terminal domain-containing protein [Anaerolineaceae bacterium]
MGVAERILEFSGTVANLEKPCHGNEQATKQFLVIPFLEKLGYRNNPADIVPEPPADIGKKGEKADYAILRDGKPVILVECKSADTNLNSENRSQLSRYFVATDARYGILTNGVEYQFYTDLCKRNVMDKSPFLTVDLRDLDDETVTEVARFAKSAFDAQAIWDLVNNRKREQRDLQTISENIARELASPSDNLVRLLAKGVLGKGNQKQAEKKRVKGLVKRALDEYKGRNTTPDDPVSPAPPWKPDPEPLHPSLESRFSKIQCWDSTVAKPELHSLFLGFVEFLNALGENVWIDTHKDGKRFFAKPRRDARFNICYFHPQPQKEGILMWLPGGRDSKRFIHNHDDLEDAKIVLSRSYEAAVKRLKT